MYKIRQSITPFAYLLLLLTLFACNTLRPGGEPTAAADVTESAGADNGAAETVDEPTPTLAAPAPSLTPLPSGTPPPTPTLPPTPLPPPTMEPTPTPVADDTLAAELTTYLETTVPLNSEADPYGGFDGVTVVPLGDDDSGRALFAGHTVGLRGSAPAHIVSLHAHDGGAWQELSRVEIEMMDILFDGSLTPQRRAGRFWLELSGGIGAHGNCYYLLRWDGNALLPDLNSCHSSFASQGMTDLNEDGQPEVILNMTDDYIFCYACVVRRPAIQLHTWTGQEWVEITLRRLPADGPTAPAVKEANDAAVTLAEAGLWADAQLAINQVTSSNDIVRWNTILINEIANMHREAAEFSTVPLLSYVFLGDYESAVSYLRDFAPQDIFVAAPPVFAGTPGEGYETTTAELIRDQMNRAIPLQPDRSAAYFLRGWAQYLLNPANPALAQPDIEQADTLAPTDPLYADSLFYFINDIGFR